MEITIEVKEGNQVERLLKIRIIGETKDNVINSAINDCAQRILAAHTDAPGVDVRMTLNDGE